MTPMNSIGAVSAQVAQYAAAWNMVDTIRGGTTAMRAAGKAYLPQEVKELDENYSARLNRSTFDNYYVEAIDRAVDKVFAKDVVLKDQPKPVEFWWNDVDTQGRDGTQFAKEVFFNAVHHGVSYILTDYPRVPAESTPKNRAEQLAAATRPYWVNVTAPMVLAADSEFIAGSERLASFRYQETVYELDEAGLNLTAFDQVRHFTQRGIGGVAGPVQFTVWRSVKGSKEGWAMVDSGILPVSAIPVTAIYGNRTGFFLGSPVQMSLAELNLQHWCKRSDLDNILHIANVPFLFGKGMTQQVSTKTGSREAPLEVNIQRAVMATNPDADLKWVEHTGSNINSAMTDLQNMENRMRDLGSTLFSSGGSFNTSATEKSINAAEANARLKSLALALQDGMEAALFYVKEYMDLAGSPGTIEVNTSFSVDYVANETMAGVVTLYKLGLVDKEVVIAEARRRNIIALDQVIVFPVSAPAAVSGTDKTIVV